MRRANTYSMCEGPLLKNIVIYTIPIILSGILQLLFNAADLIVVGQYCGSASVAAVGATGPLINLIVNLFMGISIGAGVTVAQALGSGNADEVHRTIHCAIPVAVIGGLILTVIGVMFSGTFLLWMGTPEDVIDLSSIYMEIYFCGMTANMVYNFGSAILCSAGDTKNPLFILTSAGILNVILNVIFVTLLKMNVDGVALATTISQVLSAVLVIVTLMRREDACRFEIKEMHIYRQPLIKLLKIGIPAGIQGSLFSISNVIIQSSVNSFDSVVVAGSAAAGNIEGFVYMSMHAFNQTATCFAGQNMGAGKLDRVSQTTRLCLICVLIDGIIFGGLAYIFAKPLLSIYITDSASAIGYGVQRMMLVCLPYFLCGIMDVMTGSMRGVGMSLPPTIICVFGVCVMRIVWIYTVFQLPQFHDLNGLFVSYPISWGLTFAVQAIWYLIYMSRLKKKRAAERTLPASQE